MPTMTTTVGLDTLATLTRKGNAPRTLRESFAAMAAGSLYRVRDAGAAAAGVDRVLWGETDGGALAQVLWSHGACAAFADPNGATRYTPADTTAARAAGWTSQRVEALRGVLYDGAAAITVRAVGDGACVYVELRLPACAPGRGVPCIRSGFPLYDTGVIGRDVERALGLPADTLGAPPYAEGYSDGEMWRWTVRP
jgi:hypothetical protein